MMPIAVVDDFYDRYRPPTYDRHGTERKAPSGEIANSDHFLPISFCHRDGCDRITGFSDSCRRFQLGDRRSFIVGDRDHFNGS